MTNEKILKYLAGLMNQEESRRFEKELQENNELKEELEAVESSLSKMQKASSPETESVYFANLAVRAREKMQKKKKFHFAPQLATALTAVLFLIVGIFYFDNSFEESYFTQTEIKRILENENDLENPQLNLIIDEDYYNVLSEYYEQSRSSFEIDFSVLDSLQTDLNDEELLLTTGAEDFELTENLSENEIEFLQNKIKEIKF